ncbi:hypothetical protein B7463_g6121, partial [Scytalidium lignicola]
MSRKCNKRPLSKLNTSLANNKNTAEIDEEDNRDIFEVCFPERKKTATLKRTKSLLSTQRRFAGSKSQSVFEGEKGLQSGTLDVHLEVENLEPADCKPTKRHGQTNLLLNSTITKPLSFLETEISKLPTQNLIPSHKPIITTSEKVKNRSDGLTKTTLDTLAAFRYNARTTNSSSMIQNARPVQKLYEPKENNLDISVSDLTDTGEPCSNYDAVSNGSSIPDPLFDMMKYGVDSLMQKETFKHSPDTGTSSLGSNTISRPQRKTSIEPTTHKPCLKQSSCGGSAGAMNFVDMCYGMSKYPGSDKIPPNRHSNKVPAISELNDSVLDEGIADDDMLSLFDNIPVMSQSKSISKRQNEVCGVSHIINNSTLESSDVNHHRPMQHDLWSPKCSPKPFPIINSTVLPSISDGLDAEYQFEIEDEEEMLKVLGTEICARENLAPSSSPSITFNQSVTLETPPRANCLDFLSSSMIKAQSSWSRSPNPTGLPTPVSSSKKFQANTVPEADYAVYSRTSTSHLSKLSLRRETLKPFARPNFPTPVFDRCPVMGITSRTILRTCFRIGEMLREGGRCNAKKQSAIIELYTRVIFSSREPKIMKQHFKFADLFHDRPPFPSGVILNYNTTGLMEIETSRFLEGESVLARCLGTLQKDPKDETWTFHVTNIRETNWSEIAMTKRVICGQI